jgi:hypothetical protein
LLGGNRAPDMVSVEVGTWTMRNSVGAAPYSST